MGCAGQLNKRRFHCLTYERSSDMTTFERISLVDLRIQEFEIKKGETYLTSIPDKEGNVCVFTNYWVWIPERFFDANRCTPFTT